MRLGFYYFFLVSQVPFSSCFDSLVFPKVTNKEVTFLDPSGSTPYPCFQDQVTSDVADKCWNNHELRFAEVFNCSYYCCVNDDDSRIFIPILPFAQMTLCDDGETFVGDFDRLNGFEVKTFFGASEAFHEEEDTIRYIGCVTEAFLQANSNPNEQDVFTEYITVDGGIKVEGIRKGSRIRVWDLSSGCETDFFFRTNTTRPIGTVSSEGRSVFCRSSNTNGQDNGCNGKIKLSYATDFENRPVDAFFRQSVCLNDRNVLNLDQMLSFPQHARLHDDCTKECESQGAAFALIGQEDCRCADSVELDSGTEIADQCIPCDDNNAPIENQDAFFCGYSYIFDTDFSVYQLQQYAEHSFRYFQCVNGLLYNEPEQVLSDDLIDGPTTVTNASFCLETCDQLDHEIAIISSSSDGSSYSCTCLTYYRFRLIDLSSTCLSFWCPGVLGPCVGSTNDHSVVYCRDCNENLIIGNHETGICEDIGAGTKVKHPRKMDQTSYLECIYEPMTLEWRWDTKVCPVPKIFDEDSKSCITPNNACEEIDERGILWYGYPNSLSTKACSEGIDIPLSGDASWFCTSEGRFKTKQPDRTGCKEDWIDEIQEEIDSGEDAVIIANDILSQLLSQSQSGSSSFLSGGGLISVVNLMDEVIQLRKDQQGASSGTTSKAFASPSISCLDALLTSTLSWQEIPEDSDRFGTSSAIMAQVDSIGLVTLDRMAVEDFFECESMNEVENQAIYFKTVRHFYNRNDRKFVFKNGDLKIEVPYDFITSSHECVSTIAATYNLEHLAKSELLPDHPNVSSSKTVEGLYQGILDLTLASDGHGHNHHESDFDVAITFHHKKRNGLRPKCVFWNASNLEWSDYGCKLDEQKSSAEKTVCKCNHLTNFAIIFGPGDANDPVLSVLSLVLGTISCACLVITIFVHFFFKLTNKDRKQAVEIQRNCCMMVGHLFFITVVGVKDKVDDVSCIIITLVTHFVWSSTFMWTVLEGYLLFVALVVVFDSGNEKRWPLYMAGFGLPFILAIAPMIIAVTVPNAPNYYRYDACWLNFPYMWVFVGQVALILLFNSYVMIRGFMIAFTVNIKGREDTWGKLRQWFRNLIILNYLLGITWVFGFFNFTQEKVFQYIFVIFNASSGIFILLNSVIFNQKVKEQRILRARKSVSTNLTRISSNFRRDTLSTEVRENGLLKRVASTFKRK